MFQIVNINKPQGWTSNDVVQKIKHAKKLYNEKVGHLGTLDPFATGVLPITIGKATRLFDYYLKKDKKYIALFEFGKTTDTLDIYGTITDTCDKKICEADIEKILSKFTGNISQMPPMYSAKKVEGKRAYDVARHGGEVKLQAKDVVVHTFTLLEKNAKCIKKYLKIDEKVQKYINFTQVFAFEIECSSGTYIRSLVRDVASALGTVGYVVSLVRVQAGRFDIDDSIGLDEYLDGNIINSHCVLSASDVFQDEIIVNVDEDTFRAFLDGKRPHIDCKFVGEKYFVIRYQGGIVALCFGSAEKYDTVAFLYEGDK